MSEPRLVNLPVLRRRYEEVRASQAAVRGLLRQLDFEAMKKSPWPSGRNLWKSLCWWLSYRAPFLNVVEGAPHTQSGVKEQPRWFNFDAAWLEWDETASRADQIMATFTEERWNSEVDFWSGPKMTRRMRAWEFFQSHFANRLDMEWTMVLEDICSMGHREWLEKLIGDDWYFFREGERLEDLYPP